jgi:MFS transporter, SP family, arabinose:H+ symporter
VRGDGLSDGARLRRSKTCRDCGRNAGAARVRGKGQSLGSGTHWIMNALLSLLSPIIAARSGASPFVFFSTMMVLQFVVVLIFFPEMKRVSLEQLQRILKIE